MNSPASVEKQGPAPTEAQTAAYKLNRAALNRLVLRAMGIVVPVLFILSAILDWVATSRLPGNHGVEGLVRHSDFLSNLTGALVIHEGNGQHLYDLGVQHIAQNKVLFPYFVLGSNEILPYNHLPFEALLTTPLVGLPAATIFGIWDLFTLVMLGLSLWVMQRALPVPRGAIFLVGLALVSYSPLIRSFVLGQNTPLVLLGLCLTYAAAKRKLDTATGAALLLVALKPQLLPIVGLALLLQGRWKALAAFVGMLAALCVAVMPILGPTWPLDYVKLLVGVASWQGSGGAIDPGIMHNWRGFATNLLGGLAPGLVTPLYLLLTLASAVFVAWLWLRARGSGGNPATGQAEPSHRTYDLLWAVTGIVAVLTSLHLNPHDLSLLIFPAWIVSAYALSGGWSRQVALFWLAFMWFGYAMYTVTMPMADRIGNWASTIPSVLLMSAAAVLLARLAINRHGWPTAMPKAALESRL